MSSTFYNDGYYDGSNKWPCNPPIAPINCPNSQKSYYDCLTREYVDGFTDGLRDYYGKGN